MADNGKIELTLENLARVLEANADRKEPKAEVDLTVNDLIRIVNAGDVVGKIVRELPVSHQFTISLTADQDLSNQDLTFLKSSNDDINFVSGIELENDIQFYMKHRTVNLFGYTGETFINQLNYPVGQPFPLFTHFYQTAPTGRFVNNLSSTVTATLYFTGLKRILQIIPLANLNTEQQQQLLRIATPIFG